MDPRDLIDELASSASTAESSGRGKSLGFTVSDQLASVVRDRETPSAIALLLARVTLGLHRAHRWEHERET